MLGEPTSTGYAFTFVEEVLGEMELPEVEFSGGGTAERELRIAVVLAA